MSSSVSITTALCLAASDVETLIQGRMIAAISRTFINAIPHFAICPAPYSEDEQFVTIQAWARLESCKIYSDPAELEKLAQLTVWSNKNLQNLLQERHKVFLAYLRVYRLPQPIEISAERVNSDKIGGFIRLPSTLAATTADPTLNDALFKQRYQQLINLEVPQHPELEKLHDQLIELTSSEEVETQPFLEDLKVFLGWLPEKAKTTLDPDLAWIETIDALGRRSLEEDGKGKNNWQAGTDFENVVRQSLEFLGFTVEEAYKGGSGGLDLFCSKPYPLTGECKAGKGIPPATTEELIRLGGRHLSPGEFIHSAKLVIGPGKPPTQVLETAKQWKVSIISPMSLQKLVEFQAKHPNSINLFELKEYLVAGQIDSKIDEYLDAVWQQIKVRSNIIQAVKKLKEVEQNQTQFDVTDIKAEYNANFANQNNRLNNQETREILLELSSPLTGYLGRRKANDGGDRFYFLRELQVD